MEAWEMALFQMTTQGMILAWENYIIHQDTLRLLLWERSYEDRKEQERMLMEMAIFLAEKGQLNFSKTESIMQACIRKEKTYAGNKRNKL